MQITIDIPENSWEEIRHTATTDPDSMNWYERKISEGKPLPKDHGRLIDADELEECTEIMNTISGESKYAVRMSDIRNMATLIEADKAWKEKKHEDNSIT